jgi:hypothetical protein
MNELTWSTRRVKIADLSPHPKNPRQATADEVAAVDRSLDEFGVADPLIANTDNVLIGGHLRLQRLKGKGVVEVDVRYPSRTLTPDEHEKLLLALNSAHGGWDWAVIADNFGPELLADVGFAHAELEKHGIEFPEIEPVGQSALDRRFEVVVTVRDEPEQEEVYERLKADGLDVRLLTI